MAEQGSPDRKLTRREKAEHNRAAWAAREKPRPSRLLTKAQMQALRQEAWRLRRVSAMPFSLPDFSMSPEVAELLGLPPRRGGKSAEPSDEE
jgi:hypothetical protein